jgi:hypothetical protein
MATSVATIEASDNLSQSVLISTISSTIASNAINDVLVGVNEARMALF